MGDHGQADFDRLFFDLIRVEIAVNTIPTVKKPNIERSNGGIEHGRSDIRGDEVANSCEGACRQKYSRKQRTRRPTLKLLTYNLKEGLQKEQRIVSLYKELDKTTYDIIGVCETHLREVKYQRWINGDEHHFGASEINEETKSNIGGVGFIIRAELAKTVTKVEIVSPRIAVLEMKVKRQPKPLRIIQVYAPHSGYEEEAIERFYEEIEELMKTPTYKTIVMGDYNAKVGIAKEGEKHVGKESDQERNEVGERMATFAETNRLYIMNTFFQKPQGKRYTWRAPNATHTAELDYFLSSDRQLITNVEVIRHVSGSDHRLIRATLKMNLEADRRKMFQTKRLEKTKLDEDILKQAVINTEWQLEGTLEEKANKLTETLMELQKTATTPAVGGRKEWMSPQTLDNITKRRKMEHTKENHLEYSLLSKLIGQKIKEEYNTYKLKKLQEVALQRKSLKKCKQELTIARRMMVTLKKLDGSNSKTREETEEVCRCFYTDLFNSKKYVQEKKMEDNNEEVPSILTSEIEYALKNTKNGKAPGLDTITNETLKAGGIHLWRILAELFTECLRTRKIPTLWKTSKTVLLFKKGDHEDIKNYRPICLLSSIYKLFTKIILNRIARTLDEAQPREQAGFRSGYSTIDHIHTLNQILERAEEYKLPLVLTFIDYEKAFDSVEINAVINAISKQGIQKQYVELIKDINRGCNTTIKLFHKKLQIQVKRGVRQGDTISPKLFTAVVEDVFSKLDWTKKGIRIDGEHLTHLRFADDIVLITHTMEEAEQNLNELNRLSEEIGLRINRKKTQVLRNKTSQQKEPNSTVKLGEESIEEVSSYTYLGQQISNDHNQDEEISRRRRAGWLAFRRISEIMKKLKDHKVRTQLFNSMVLPAMLYGCETWNLRKSDKEKLKVTQRAMEKRILGVTRRDEIHNKDLRKQTNFNDIVQSALINKLRWAGHIARK
uniref:Reverse transcriptase domain-containing protein n=1 Tax=Strongyloides papillosus TaxID=174720 RepID=A0A0N5C0B1_STREA